MKGTPSHITRCPGSSGTVSKRTAAASKTKERPGDHVRTRLFPWPILVALIIGSWTAGCAVEPVDTQTEELYRQGNLLYEGGKYAESSRTYERIVDRGIRNGYVYYNLGNAYYKQDQLGRAILAYERASRLIPRDGDLKNNLYLANERTVDQITGDVPWFGRQALDAVTMNEATVAATITGFIASLSLMIYLLARQTSFRVRAGYLSGVTGLIFLLAIGFTGVKIYDHFANEEGIVLSATAVVRTSPDEASDPVFTLHEGVKVQLVEHRQDWMRIQLPDGKNGWLAQDELEGI